MENIINNVDEKAVKVGIKMQDADFIVSLLTTKLYQYKLQSAIREITTNAVDANKEAGSNHPVLIQVSEKDNGDYTISIRDFGVGLSPERFKEVFIYAGASTKRDDIKQQGMFGIGRFAVMAYTDKAAISSFYNGKKYKYIMQKNKKTIEFVEESVTDTYLQNGMSYTWTVKEKDTSDLIDALIHISHIKNVNVVAPKDIKKNLPEYTEFNNFDVYVNSEYIVDQEKILISIDGVLYPMPYELDRKITALPDNLNIDFDAYEHKIILKFNTKELEVVPSREAIEDIPENRLKIQNKVSAVRGELFTMIKSKLPETTDNPNDMLSDNYSVKLKNNLGVSMKYLPKYKGNSISLRYVYPNYTTIREIEKKYNVNKVKIKTYTYSNYHNLFKKTKITDYIPTTEKYFYLLQFLNILKNEFSNTNIIFSDKDVLGQYDKWYLRYFFNIDSDRNNALILKMLSEEEIKKEKEMLIDAGIDENHVNFLIDLYNYNLSILPKYYSSEMTKEERATLRNHYSTNNSLKANKNKKKKGNKEQISIREVILKSYGQGYKLSNIIFKEPVKYWKDEKRHIIYTSDIQDVEKLKIYRELLKYSNSFSFIKIRKSDVKKVKDLKGYASLEEFKNGKFSKHVNRHYQTWYIRSKFEKIYQMYKAHLELNPYVLWDMKEKFFFKELGKIHNDIVYRGLENYFPYLRVSRNTLDIVNFLENQKIDLAKYYYKSNSIYEVLTVFKKDKLFKINPKVYKKIKEEYYEEYKPNTKV